MRCLGLASKFGLLLAAIAGLSSAGLAQQIQPTISTSASVSGGLLTTTTRLDQSSRFAHHPSRVIVRFKSGAPSFLPGSGRAIELSRERNTHLVINPPGLSVRDTIARYRQNPNVIFAEPDYIVQAIGAGTATPNDPSIAQQWDMTKISAPAVWANPPATGDTVVAVVDTGIDFTHPDLAANLYSDANNPSVHGFTCIGGSCVAGGQDDYGHGTHVAGTIGAVGNNAIGMAGMNWSTKLLSIKFLDANGSGAISDAVLGFQKILALKKPASGVGINIRVTNNSWGGGGFSQALQDAMLAVEGEGILNVCAAGNSGVNADTSPMYPGAYNNRGIVSVLATDANDLAAYFSNYGVASVDIAAPGVSTLSTVPTGTCALCDPSGYKLLSGTSMASPHVAGAAVAMLAAYPNLTAAQARDALLNPMTYDTLTDEKARRTSSGGRLNFTKLLANAGQFQTLPANQFPTVSVGPDAFVASGGSVSFTQNASDPDGDTLRSMIGRAPISNWSAWIFEWRANKIFPATAPFTAPQVSTVAVVPYDSSVSDNRGGGASGRNWATVTPTSTNSVPTVSISIPQSAYTVGEAVPVSVAVTGLTGTSWDINAATTSSSSGSCCYSGTGVSLTFNTAGVYRITSQAVDPELNTSAMNGTSTALAASKVVIINPVGGTTPIANPPVAAIKLDKKSGTAPLTINVDASGSADADGSIATYYFDCGVGYASGQASQTASCNFTQPGTYWVRVLVMDNANFMGIASDYVVVAPAQPGSDVTPPNVSITSPVASATLVTPTTVQVTASDAGGIKQVTCYVDTASTPCGAMTGSGPYNFQFDPATLASYGSHTIFATAKDNAGNASSTSLSITTAAPTLPTITLTPSSTTLQRNKSKTFTATLSNVPTYGLSGVVFKSQKGSTLTTYPIVKSSPYTLNFSTSTAGTYTLTATPYDNAPGGAKAGTPASVTIAVK